MIRFFSALFIFFAGLLSAKEFILLTQPKTGTHLLVPILSDLTGKEPYCPRQYMKESSKLGQQIGCKIIEGEFCCPDTILEKIWQTNLDQATFLHFHTPFTREFEAYLTSKDCVVFFVKRDPRDQIVSLLNHYKKFGFIDQRVAQYTTDDERILFMIRHHMKANLQLFKGWLSSTIAVVLDFDKLMGSHGGHSSDEEAVNEIRKLASALSLDVSDDELDAIYHKHFGAKGAFFRGKVGSWKDYFSDQHKQAVKEEVGLTLIELGFEQDLNW